MTRELIIMRGLPGSGKSFETQKLKHEHEAKGRKVSICSTDDLFTTKGVYRFVPELAGEYHAKNQENARNCILSHVDTIIIDNVNAQSRHFRPYFMMGYFACYYAHFVSPSSPEWLAAKPYLGKRAKSKEAEKHWKTFSERCQHGVDFVKMYELAKGWEIDDDIDPDIRIMQQILEKQFHL